MGRSKRLIKKSRIISQVSFSGGGGREGGEGEQGNSTLLRFRGSVAILWCKCISAGKKGRRGRSLSLLRYIYIFPCFHCLFKWWWSMQLFIYSLSKTNTPQSSSKYPPGVTKERLLQALPTLGILNEHQWNTLPDGDDVLLVNNVLALNNISMFSAATQLGKVSNRTWLLPVVKGGRQYQSVVDYLHSACDFCSIILGGGIPRSIPSND